MIGDRMKEIKSYEDLKEEFMIYKVLPMESQKIVNAKDFDGLFKCGCGDQHEINSDEIETLICVAFNRFVLKCKKNTCSMVAVKGFFTTKFITEWFCKPKLVNKLIKETNYHSLDASAGLTQLVEFP